MTTHIKVDKKSDIAKIVLMPGDPLRAKHMANKFLENPRQVNFIRNQFMFTGYYKGKKVTIAGSGMGMASIAIYSYELFKFFDVDVIIRVGSSGAYLKEINTYQVVLASEIYLENKSFLEFVNNKTNILYPSKKLNQKILETSKELNFNLISGRIHSSDIFYDEKDLDLIKKTTKAIAVEMEAGALFSNAIKLGKQAACLLTISNNLVTKKSIDAHSRQTKFVEMFKLALEVSLKC